MALHLRSMASNITFVLINKSTGISIHPAERIFNLLVMALELSIFSLVTRRRIRAVENKVSSHKTFRVEEPNLQNLHRANGRGTNRIEGDSSYSCARENIE